MANSPIPDQSKQFRQSGMKLITDPSSDVLLAKSKLMRDEKKQKDSLE